MCTCTARDAHTAAMVQLPVPHHVSVRPQSFAAPALVASQAQRNKQVYAPAAAIPPQTCSTVSAHLDLLVALRSNIGTSSGPLAGVASSLLGDSTIAQQVQVSSRAPVRDRCGVCASVNEPSHTRFMRAQNKSGLCSEPT